MATLSKTVAALSFNINYPTLVANQFRSVSGIRGVTMLTYNPMGSSVQVADQDIVASVSANRTITAMGYTPINNFKLGTFPLSGNTKQVGTWY